MPCLPSYTDFTLTFSSDFPPNLQPLSNAYHELAQVYSTNNPSELRNLVNKHSETFTRDSNMGLVKQCLSSLYKKNIQRLTKVSRAVLGPWPRCPPGPRCRRGRPSPLRTSTVRFSV